MYFIKYKHNGKEHLGARIGQDKILNLEPVLIELDIRKSSLKQVIELDPKSLSRIQDYIAHEPANASDLLDIQQVSVLAPFSKLNKNIFCVGRNYKEHVLEAANARGNQVQLPEYVQFFTKPPTALNGPYDDIPWDASLTQELDYEVELAIIIGKTGKNISREDAYDYIFGYTVINDITGRDLQKKHGQWFKGKGLDGSCPMGPVVVHKSEIPDPQALTVRLTVNGEQRQFAPTSMMIFDIPEIIHQLSAGLTLEVGDIIATGTPSGVGFAMKPSGVLKNGDVVEAEVSGIGKLVNKVKQVA
ncbi:fumarylacetoacetate hydrolase family protein [Advenella kashmirensis]